MSTNEIWTVKRVLHWLTQKFNTEGFSNPRLEAELTVAYAIAGDRIKVYMELEKPLTEMERNILRKITKRRLAYEPFAYIVGKKEFYSLEFKVDQNVLIPRPETEFLVEYALKHIKPNFKIVDVGTGSGAIAVAIAVNAKNIEINASDISAKALEIAKLNAYNHQVEINFKQGNLLEAFPNMKFNLIIANLPYIPQNYILPPDVAFEPKSALFSGQDGLDLIRKFLNQVPVYIHKGGLVLMEFGDNQKNAIEQMILQYHYVFHKDYAGLYRFVEITF